MKAAGIEWRPCNSARNALLMPGVVPSPQRDRMETEIGASTVVTNQFAPLGRWGVAGTVAAAAWLVLLAGGVAGTLADRQRRPIGLALGLFLASKILFHSVYGEITFLYAADIAAAALAFAALGWFSPYRKTVVGALVL